MPEGSRAYHIRGFYKPIQFHLICSSTESQWMQSLLNRTDYVHIWNNCCWIILDSGLSVGFILKWHRSEKYNSLDDHIKIHLPAERSFVYELSYSIKVQICRWNLFYLCMIERRIQNHKKLGAKVLSGTITTATTHTTQFSINWDISSILP